ncbi:venom acid phosphatase Acph-1-like [Athalia rosae]|uniref:venom acid phosphatase Acph-1-like n=1 Tax=Athalia rosae TaxID=37344 RepID=UPI0020341DDF|nr:venom acid phosphatase Acph-1-like [Athalia rosae]
MKNVLAFVCWCIVMNKEVVFGDTVENEAKVKLLSVLFRHGDRTPDPSIGGTYPNDPYQNYTYFPVGLGGLTNKGKMRVFKLGQALRLKYDEFLGDLYYPDVLEGRSTDYDRTKMALQMVLNGLFPPAPIQQWKDGVDWQPIPTVYFHEEEDWVLRSDLCPKYIVESNRYLNSAEFRERLAEHKNLTEFLEKVTGESSMNADDLFVLHSTLITQLQMGLDIPEWATELLSNGRLEDAASLRLEAFKGNDELKRLWGGMLLRKITDDFLSYRNGSLPDGRKIFLYSAHDLNVAGLLSTLGVYDSRFPQYSSAVIIELLEYENDYFVKVIYYLGIPPKFIVMQIPGCTQLCPLDKFLYQLENVIATDEDIKCN